jgi:hypothetical protein
MERDHTEDVWEFMEDVETEGTDELVTGLAGDPSFETRRILDDDAVHEDEDGDDVMIATMEPEERAPEVAAMHVTDDGGRLLAEDLDEE